MSMIDEKLAKARAEREEREAREAEASKERSLKILKIALPFVIIGGGLTAAIVGWQSWQKERQAEERAAQREADEAKARTPIVLQEVLNTPEFEDATPPEFIAQANEFGYSGDVSKNLDGRGTFTMRSLAPRDSISVRLTIDEEHAFWAMDGIRLICSRRVEVADPYVFVAVEGKDGACAHATDVEREFDIEYR